MLGHELDLEGVRQGRVTPVFFGSAMNNFGVELFLQVGMWCWRLWVRRVWVRVAERWCCFCRWGWVWVRRVPVRAAEEADLFLQGDLMGAGVARDLTVRVPYDNACATSNLVSACEVSKS